MRSLKQLLRQPVKTLAGILAISIAVSALCICFGQAIATDRTEAQLQYRFTTIALPSTKYNYRDVNGVSFDGKPIIFTTTTTTMPAEILEWINNTAQSRPDLVETISSQGLASAYIKELIPENVTDFMYYHPVTGTAEGDLPFNMSGENTYARTMLEIVLEQIGEVNVTKSTGKTEDGTPVALTVEASVEIVGSVKSVVALEEGYDDPTGRTIRLSVTMPDEESINALNLSVGERYLVYGTDYLDGEWALEGWISRNLNYRLKNPVELKELEEKNFEYLSEEDKAAFLKANPHASAAPLARYWYKNDNTDENWTDERGIAISLGEEQLNWHNAVLLSVEDATIMGDFQYIAYSDKSGYCPTMNWDRYITDENGNKVQVTQEQYSALYSVPTIAHLEGTVEEFLQSEAGSLWAEKLEQIQVNYQAFAVIGVEKMGYIADFARETAKIVEGRDFTAEELESGAKVCIISESLATANGLKVGDVISPRFYNYDYDDPYQEFLENGYGLLNPTAYAFTSQTEWAGEAEEYVIVGLYRQDNAWCDVRDNSYSFTPNTIFVPKSSISSDMDYGTHGIFRTLVLRNGAIEEFRALVEGAGYPDLFVFYDQQYTTVSDSLENYREVAQRVMMIGFGIYGAILALYLLFFTGSQGKVLTTMDKLGTQRRYKIAHIIVNSAGILILGTIIGGGLGMLLWQKVINAVGESVGEAISLEMDVAIMMTIALVQMLVALVLVALLAVPMTREKRLGKGK